MGKKPIISVSYENERISIKKAETVKVQSDVYRR